MMQSPVNRGFFSFSVNSVKGFTVVFEKLKIQKGNSKCKFCVKFTLFLVKLLFYSYLA